MIQNLAHELFILWLMVLYDIRVTFQVLNYNPVLGAFLIGSCIVFMTFVVLNLFISVILVAFSQEQIHHKVTHIYTYLKALCVAFQRHQEHDIDMCVCFSYIKSQNANMCLASMSFLMERIYDRLHLFQYLDFTLMSQYAI